jgi:signal transduction histidine kinase
MRSASEVAERPERGLFGIVPPGRPTDVAVAALTGVAQIGLTIGASRNQPSREPLDLLAYLLLAAGPVALLWRRRAPVWVLVAVTASNVLYFALGYPYGPAWLSLIVAIWTAVTAGARRAAWAIALLGLAAYFALAALLGRVHPATVPEIAAHLGWLLLVLVVAEVAMAGRQRRLAAERTRAEEARRRAGEERMRIARELHDVLAHNISLINVQAGVALHLLDEHPEQARPALTTIKEASRDALHELRAALDVLRRGDDAPRAPAPTLADLEPLVGAVRAGGLEVEIDREAVPAGLPAEVQLAAFRIVQESLTNVSRHARASRATVRLRGEDGRLTVEVEDDGTTDAAAGRASSTPGMGISGMRRRAEALGGMLDAGPRAGGGFRVAAVLPLRTDGLPS